MQTKFLVNIREGRQLNRAGNKAGNLRRLLDHGFPVPETYVITWDAYQEYLRDNVSIVERIRAELERVVRPGQGYAVRSSANIEDGEAFSFAGQFKTVLNARGIDEILSAIWAIWATACTESVRMYLKQMQPIQPELKMGVIVQEMVAPVYSGVAFSKNPVTGVDEIVVEGVQGNGTALVQGGVTPDCWIFKWDEWVTQPEQPHIPTAVIEQVVALVQKAAQVFKRAVDMEWVSDGEKVYAVQMRDITSTSKAVVYSNRIAKDMLPGMIKPLVWSINVPMVNTVWVNFLTEMIGKNSIDPLTLAKPFYYRAYFNMSVLGEAFNKLGLPSETLDMMMGLGPRGMRMPNMRLHSRMVLIAPNLIGMVWDKFRFHKRIETQLPGIEAELANFQQHDLAARSDADILAELSRLFSLTQRAAYLNIVGPLLMFFYNGMLNSRLKKQGIDPEQFDIMDGMHEWSEYEPGRHLHSLHAHYQQLDQAAQEKIAASSFADFQALDGIDTFRSEVNAFLTRFGHLSDSGNDISMPNWREIPDLVLKMIVTYNPYAVPHKSRMGVKDLPGGRLKGWMTRFFYHRARRFRLYREHISFMYTKTYGAFRPYWLELGRRMAERGLLRAPEDVFYLYQEEAKAALSGDSSKDYARLAASRCQEMAAMQNLVLPVVIYGDTPPPVVGISEDRLSGIPASRGVYTGRVRVVRSVGDLSRLQAGDVLVVPYSDVGWTPLFAQAGGVIAESGGLLSHSSIIAREYRIPAVVSVAGATLLKDNTLVTIDGYKGEVLIHKDGEEHGRTGDRIGSERAAQAV